MLGKVGDAYVYTFSVRSRNGAPRTGLVPGNFTATVRNPQDTASDVPAVSEVAGGMYRFTIPGAFTTTHGAGEYGITVEVTLAPFDISSDTIPFFVNDPDDLATAAALAVVQADTDDIQTGLPVAAQLDVRQGWTRVITPNDRMRTIIHIEQDGDRVALPGTAELALLATDRAGTTIAAFTTSGVLAGAKGYFSFETLDFTPTDGEVITVEATVTLSGVGSGTHVGRTQVAFPEF